MKRPYQSFGGFDLLYRKHEISIMNEIEMMKKIDGQTHDQTILDWCKLNLKQIQNEVNYRAELNAC